MRGRRMVVLAVVVVGVLAAGLWLTMACEQQAADPTPEPLEVRYEDPATLCAPVEGGKMTPRKVPIERARAVLDEQRERIRRQPNLVHFGVNRMWDTDGNRIDEVGIVIGVSEKVDQSTLPEQDRIPGCLDGVPVQFIEGVEIEFLGDRL